jgi:carboxylesterase
MKMFIIVMLFVLSALLVAGCLYSRAARKALVKEIAETPRDPETGIVKGTEPLTLEGKGGKACLLIHGWLGSRIDYHDLPERLHEQGLTVRMMLLDGHGTTPEDLANKGVDDFLRGVKAEFAELKASYRDVTVIGFSLGGACAALLASEEDVTRLILVAPFFDVTYRYYYVLSPETWNSLLSPFFDYIMKGKAFIRVNREEAKEHIYSYQVIPTVSVAVLCEAGRRARSPECLKKITCPVLLLHAHGDMAACPDAAREAFNRIGSLSKTIVLFDRSNHHILWDFDGPEAMERIMAFISAGADEPR